MEKTEIRRLLQPILWDYQIDPYDLFLAAPGRKERIGSFTQRTALIRMLERLFWYDLIRLFGMEELTRLLKPELIRLSYKKLFISIRSMSGDHDSRIGISFQHFLNGFWPFL